jgi:glyoxylase-like metal-dependent hydrolase (beta-lactamase superfamily II)
VLLTHIHLDHAGAAGWWAQQGARIHVHPVGAPHLLNPEKLLASAQRIYGGDMERLWGAFLPVPPAQLIEHSDNDTIEVGGHSLTALNTPGHAEHHFAYLLQDICFSGDVGGVRVGGLGHVRPPTPPPEIHFEKWRASIARLRAAKPSRIAPTHFGVYADVPWHLDALERGLDAIENWTAQEMAGAPTPELFRAHYAALLAQLARADGYDAAQAAAYGDAAGSDMSADGVYRYWKKFRAA